MEAGHDNHVITGLGFWASCYQQPLGSGGGLCPQPMSLAELWIVGVRSYWTLQICSSCRAHYHSEWHRYPSIHLLMGEGRSLLVILPSQSSSTQKINQHSLPSLPPKKLTLSTSFQLLPRLQNLTCSGLFLPFTILLTAH